MKRRTQIFSCVSGFLLYSIVVFANQISQSACIWWMHQPKEPDSLCQNGDE